MRDWSGMDATPTVISAFNRKLNVFDAPQGIHGRFGHRNDRAGHERSLAPDVLVVQPLANAAWTEHAAFIAARGNLFPCPKGNDEIGEAVFMAVRTLAILTISGAHSFSFFDNSRTLTFTFTFTV